MPFAYIPSPSSRFLVDSGPLHIRWYGLALALAVLVGSSIARREIARVFPESPLVRLTARAGGEVEQEHVIYKSYYLLDRPVGRIEGPPYVEALVRGGDAQVLFLAQDLLGALSRNDILAGIVRQLVARTSLVVSLYENQSTMSCWHDDHGDFIDLLEAHRVQPAVTLMRKHLSHVEESLNFNSPARGPLDLRKIYAPNTRS